MKGRLNLLSGSIMGWIEGQISEKGGSAFV